MSTRKSSRLGELPGKAPPATNTVPHRRLCSIAVPALLLVLLGGCALIHKTVELPARMVAAILPGAPETEPADPIKLQDDLLRFADNFVFSTTQAAEHLSTPQGPINRADLLAIKLALATDVYGLASGSNPLSNLVSLTVLASEARHRIEDYWLPKVYGPSAEPLLRCFKDREREIWAIAERTLSPAMRAELRKEIERWRRSFAEPNADPEAFAGIAMVNDITKGLEVNRSSTLPNSVFGLLGIDPLAGLDPAARELAETRLFAERALFIGQRLPQTMGWQAELLALRSAEIPEVASLVGSGSQIAGSSERLSKSIESLPAFLSSERESVLKAFTQERIGLVGLAQATKETLAEGTHMVQATTQVLKSYEGIAQQLQDAPDDPNAPPFDIREWGKAAGEVSHMSAELHGLLNLALSATRKDQLAAITQASRETGEALVDYAFRKLLLLVVLSGLFITGLRLAYHWLRVRLSLHSG